MLKRFSIILAVWAWAGAAFAAAPPSVWTQLSASGTAIYDSAGNVVGPGNPLAVSGSSISSITAPSVSPTISASAYTAGYVLGGIESFTVPPTGVIQNVITDFNTGAYVGGVSYFIFNANPTGGGTTDHAALAIAAVDMPKLIGVISASSCALAATVTSYCQAQNVSLAYSLPAGTTIYVVKQVVGAPTFTNATDDTDTLDVIQ